VQQHSSSANNFTSNPRKPGRWEGHKGHGPMGPCCPRAWSQTHRKGFR